MSVNFQTILTFITGHDIYTVNQNGILFICFASHEAAFYTKSCKVVLQILSSPPFLRIFFISTIRRAPALFSCVFLQILQKYFLLFFVLFQNTIFVSWIVLPFGQIFSSSSKTVFWSSVLPHCFTITFTMLNVTDQRSKVAARVPLVYSSCLNMAASRIPYLPLGCPWALHSLLMFWSDLCTTTWGRVRTPWMCWIDIESNLVWRTEYLVWTVWTSM